MCLSKDLNVAIFADLFADPVVRMVMRADQVTEHQLIEAMGVTLSKREAESETELSVVEACDKSNCITKTESAFDLRRVTLNETKWTKTLNAMQQRVHEWRTRRCDGESHLQIPKLRTSARRKCCGTF